MKRALSEKTLKEYLDSNYTKYEVKRNEITIHTDSLCIYVTPDEIVGPHVRVDGKHYYFVPRNSCPKYATDLLTDETVTHVEMLYSENEFISLGLGIFYLLNAYYL